MKILKVLLILVFGIGMLVGCKTNKEEKEVSKYEEKIKDGVTSNFKFTNLSSSFKDNNSVFETLITNITSDELYLKEFVIHVLDKEGNEMIALSGYVEDKISSNSEKIITCSYGGDLSNYSSLKYEVVEKE